MSQKSTARYVKSHVESGVVRNVFTSRLSIWRGSENTFCLQNGFISVRRHVESGVVRNVFTSRLSTWRRSENTFCLQNGFISVRRHVESRVGSPSREPTCAKCLDICEKMPVGNWEMSVGNWEMSVGN